MNFKYLYESFVKVYQAQINFYRSWGMAGDFNRRVDPKSINYGPIFDFFNKRK